MSDSIAAAINSQNPPLATLDAAQVQIVRVSGTDWLHRRALDLRDLLPAIKQGQTIFVVSSNPLRTTPQTSSQ
jgi:hypothetical protein